MKVARTTSRVLLQSSGGSATGRQAAAVGEGGGRRGRWRWRTRRAATCSDAAGDEEGATTEQRPAAVMPSGVRGGPDEIRFLRGPV